MRKFIYQLHLLLGVAVSIPVLAWALSGFLYALPNTVEGGTVEKIDAARVRISPPEAMAKASELAGKTLPTTALTLLMKDGRPHFLSNQAGGILGGISTGQDIVVRFAVKPTSSILTPRKTITRDGQETEIQTKGRHDPCVGIRAVPVGEAMMAIVLADQFLRHRAQCGT